MDVEVSPENTVSGTAIIAVDESLIELSGQSRGSTVQGHGSVRPPRQRHDGAATRRTGSSGRTITFDEVPLEEFTGNNSLSGAGGGSGDELNIVRRG